MKLQGNFKHDLLPSLDIQQITEDTGRRYVTPEGSVYPSVTTVLSKMLDKSGLDKWREKVGQEKAATIMRQAASRGTAVHNLLEDYVSNKPVNLLRAMPSNVMLFNQIRNYIDNRIGTVYGIETSLYSDTLKTAGKCDLVCLIDDTLHVVDYKTSTNFKREEWINGYFLQATTYAIMLEERYGIEVPAFSILIAVESDNLQVVSKSTYEYREEVYDLFKTYHS